MLECAAYQEMFIIAGFQHGAMYLRYALNLRLLDDTLYHEMLYQLHVLLCMIIFKYAKTYTYDACQY
jgi:hypothetical protein